MLRLLAPAFAGDGIVLAAKDAPAAILAVTLRSPPSATSDADEFQESQEPCFFYSSSSSSKLTGTSVAISESETQRDTEPNSMGDAADLQEDGQKETEIETSADDSRPPARQQGRRGWWKAGKPFVRHTLEYFDPNCGKFVSVQIPFSPPERKALDSRLLVNGATVLAKARAGNERGKLHYLNECPRSPELEALLKSPPPADLFSLSDDSQKAPTGPEEGAPSNGSCSEGDDDSVITV